MHRFCMKSNIRRSSLLWMAVLVLIPATAIHVPGAQAQGEVQRRPQSPVPPFPYKQREVTYANPADGIQLFGTLTVPGRPARHPAVILVPGSGGADRDATAAGHKPFLVIADHLTRRSLSVLRVDSRKADKYFESTCEDFAGDVLSGISFLKKQPDIDTRRIGVIGHSLGGLVAAMVAARSSDVAFLVLLAGVAVPARELSQMQRAQRLRARGLSEEEVRRRLESSLALYDRLAAGDDNPALDAELREFLKLQLPVAMQVTSQRFEEIVKQERATLRSRYYAFLHTSGPRRQAAAPAPDPPANPLRVVSAPAAGGPAKAHTAPPAAS